MRSLPLSKTNMKNYIYKKIIYIYVCQENIPEILLLSKDNIDFVPLGFDYTVDKLIDTKQKILEEFSLEEKDFYKDRLNGSYDTIHFKEGEKMVWVSVHNARIKEGINISSKNYPYIKWVKKEDVLKELKTKEHIRSFKRMFNSEYFWECLDTEK